MTARALENNGGSFPCRISCFFDSGNGRWKLIRLSTASGYSALESDCRHCMMQRSIFGYAGCGVKLDTDERVCHFESSSNF